MKSAQLSAFAFEYIALKKQNDTFDITSNWHENKGDIIYRTNKDEEWRILMGKRVYISADYSKSNGDRSVVEELHKWGMDNKQ